MNDYRTSPDTMKHFVNCLFTLIVLMEKLLRTCDVESIYILIRNKKEDDIHTRVGKIFDDPVSKQQCHDDAVSLRLYLCSFSTA